MRKYSVLLIGLIAGFLAAPLSAADLTNKPAPDFTLNARDGKPVTLSQLRGQVVMINFWATWCGPCRQEMPLLEQIYKKHKPLGFTLLGVSVDSKDAEAAVKAASVSFPVLLDQEQQVSKLYGVNGMPNTVLIDRKGNVRYVHRGYKPGDENTYINCVKTLIKE